MFRSSAFLFILKALEIHLLSPSWCVRIFRVFRRRSTLAIFQLDQLLSSPPSDDEQRWDILGENRKLEHSPLKTFNDDCLNPSNLVSTSEPITCCR